MVIKNTDLESTYGYRYCLSNGTWLEDTTKQRFTTWTDTRKCQFFTEGVLPIENDGHIYLNVINFLFQEIVKLFQK